MLLPAAAFYLHRFRASDIIATPCFRHPESSVPVTKNKSLGIRIWRLAAKHKRLLFLAFLTTILYSIFNAATLWVSASFLETIFSASITEQVPVAASGVAGLNDTLKNMTRMLVVHENRTDTLIAVCILLLAAFLFKNIFAYSRGVLLGIVRLRIIVDLRNRIFHHLNTLQIGYYDNKKGGEITSIAINDVAIMNRMLFSGISRLLFVPFEVLTLLVILVIISWKLSLVTFIFIPVSGMLLVTIGNSIRRKSRRALKQISEVVHIIQEVVQSIRVVKAFCTEHFEMRRFEKTNARFFGISLKRLQLQQLSSPLNEFIGAVIGIALLWYAGREVLAGQGLTSEDFIRFMIVLFSLFQPLRTLSGLNNMLNEGLAAGERVFSLIDQEPDFADSPSSVSVTAFEREIAYESVSFRYNSETEKILDKISFTIRKGEVVALVGPSGAGKSTIADLLPRFYDLSEGAITIDGTDIKDIRLESLRTLMGIVSQETLLFNDTLFNNIAYGSFGANREQVEAAAHVANAYDFICELADGFDTIIGDRGVKLSGGQRQRISIARAVLKNPPILILDEATSSLDTESEKQVQEALQRLMSNRTALVIAHRLSTVTNADRIIMIERGKISGMGPHAELLKTCSSYERLHSLQFSNKDGTA